MGLKITATILLRDLLRFDLDLSVLSTLLKTVGDDVFVNKDFQKGF